MINKSLKKTSRKLTTQGILSLDCAYSEMKLLRALSLRIAVIHLCPGTLFGMQALVIIFIIACTACWPTEVFAVSMAILGLSEVFARNSNTKKHAGGTTIRILPKQPIKRNINDPGSTNGASATKPDGFFEAFGYIGIMLFLAAGVSVCWTLWLIVLTIAPNDTANYLMDTAEFDDGQFWLIIDPEPDIMSVNAIALAALAISYVHVMLKMTVLRNSSCRITPLGPRENEVYPMWTRRLYIGKYLQQAVLF
ncbi:unnamed protein product [Phytophthora lilii]|uniref:Unnamed protein product n=1 Tax=Phytophthora lilii TaxID=2077276 RepID=A0A9W6X1J4_9STRA|nr:unnamed protein product [Phytophthora lilii]